MDHTNHPVRYIGPIRFPRMRIARLCDVQAACRLELERDLRDAPTPISGGMRKALNKELGQQNALRYRSPGRRYGEADLRRAHGLIEATCSHCRHTMFFDEVDDDPASIRCDRCKRPIW
jgi:hypothetical protein